MDYKIFTDDWRSLLMVNEQNLRKRIFIHSRFGHLLPPDRVLSNHLQKYQNKMTSFVKQNPNH